MYFNGQRVWSETLSGTGAWLLQDRLGSTTLAVSSSGGILDQIGYYPYGGRIPYSSVTVAPSVSFTGYEDDGDTDYAVFRNLNTTYGRFTRPDPDDGSYAFTNPQSLNRYSYVLNNPLNYVDRLGLDCVIAHDGGVVSVKSGDCPGDDPNNEYYYDCGEEGDGCLSRANSGNMDPTARILGLWIDSDGNNSILIARIPDFDYTAPDGSGTDSVSPGPYLSVDSGGVVAPNNPAKPAPKEHVVCGGGMCTTMTDEEMNPFSKHNLCIEAGVIGLYLAPFAFPEVAGAAGVATGVGARTLQIAGAAIGVAGGTMCLF